MLVVAAVLLGQPLFDLLDVSGPAGRLAVAAVAGLFSAVRIVQRPPQPQPGLHGLRAALMPVAVPLAATPAVVLLALSAGADRGAWFVAGVMALGVGLVTASTLVPEDGTSRTVAAWANRLIAAAAVVACVLLGVNAVLDV